MDPVLCRKLNEMSLELLASYLNVDYEEVRKLYQELLDDTIFLNEINEQIADARTFYKEGICRHEKTYSVDWFAIQRIMLYILVRMFLPSVCLETGVFYGGTTCFILNALRKNKHGKLISIDLVARDIDRSVRHHLVGDTEDMPEGLDIGFLVHQAQKRRWVLIKGNTLNEISKIDEKIDLYNHDSDHSFNFIAKEMSLVWDKLSDNAIIVADDVDWSNGFFSFCVKKKLYPLIVTDNGKSGLRARTGIATLNHLLRKKSDVVGK